MEKEKNSGKKVRHVSLDFTFTGLSAVWEGGGEAELDLSKFLQFFRSLSSTTLLLLV